MNRDFLFKYGLASLLIVMLLSVAFFYDKERQEQYFENDLLNLTKHIDFLNLELNQTLLKLRVNLSNETEVNYQLKDLLNSYQLLSAKISTDRKLYDDLMHSHLNLLYSQLHQKKQAIEQFKTAHQQQMQRMNGFQQAARRMVLENQTDETLKDKIHLLQHLVLPRFENPILIPPVSPLQLLNELLNLSVQNPEELKQLVSQAKLIFADEDKIRTLLNTLIQPPSPPLSEAIEQHIVGYFNSKLERKSSFQNRLFFIAILSVLYVVYLLSSLRKKSDALKNVIAEVEKYQIALNQHAIVSAADVKGNIIYVNDKFCETSGYQREELIGKNHRIVKSNEHSKEVFETMWRTICKGEVWHGEIKNKKKDGGFYWVNGTIVPFLNEKGKPYQYISIRTDITRQKELEQQLLEGQHFLKQVTGAMAQGLYALDENGLCTFWNKEAENTLGWTEEELLHKNLHQIIHFQDEHGNFIPTENCLSHNSILNNQIYSSETESFTHKDGRILPISIIAVPLLEKDKSIGTVAVFNDISKRKEDERIVKQAIINAQQASQAKSDFLANMSHEIRTPMNGIIGMTELTLETELNHEQREYLEIVKDSSYALLEIVNDILDFSKIESGKLVLEHIEFNLQELLKKTLAILMPRAEQKGIRLSIDDSEISRLNCLLVGDPGRLRQVLLNLVGNAIKFTLQGSVTVKVLLTEKLSSQCCLLFTVTDTGIGIPEDKKDSIFDAFSQADTSVTRRFGGTGLGLSISKQFIELMSGKIWLESEVNTGTTFFFTCWFEYQQLDHQMLQPSLSDSSALLAQQPTEASKQSVDMTAGNAQNTLGLNILLAEDNLINQKLAKKLLDKQGYHVTIANNGLEAVTLFEQQKFDLILMDFQMPEMNGLEASTRIRDIEQEKGGHIPIIAMTANAMKENKERALNAGMDAYVPKPINVQELLTEIGRFFPADGQTAPPPVEKTENGLIYNWDAALARLGGEAEILEMLVNLFLDEHDTYLKNIKTALDKEDGELLYRELHTLKGVCATIGADRLEKAIKVPESAAAQKNFADCRAGLAKIEQDLHELTALLRKRVGK
jgi:PAS domain S-box-containing protein